jgi:hypothetical protein
VYCNHRNDENDRHWQAGDPHEGTEQDCYPAEHLHQNGEPREQMRFGNPKRLEDVGKIVRAPLQFGDAVSNETISDYEAQRALRPRISALAQTQERVRAHISHLPDMLDHHIRSFAWHVELVTDPSRREIHSAM